jgi:hypothetical protein
MEPGYFDGAVAGDNMVVLEPGEFASSEAIAPDSRKIIFVGTHFGTVAVFQWFTESSEVIVSNTTDKIRQAEPVAHGSLQFDNLKFVIGDATCWEPERNLGTYLSKILSIAPAPIEE